MGEERFSCLIGIKGRDFVLLATDCTAVKSIVAMKKDENKTFQLSNRLLMAASGEGGDTVQFAEYIAKNIQLYRMRNDYELSTREAAAFTRRNLADYLRSNSMYLVSLLIGGHDDEVGPSLYFMDYLASSVEVPFGAHGFGSYFALSVLDRYYKENLTEQEAMEVLQRCINEISTRLIISLPKFSVRIVDRNGIHIRPDLTAKDLDNAEAVTNSIATAMATG